MAAYYNEIDPKAAAWLRELIKQGHIAPGDVDERSIEDVKPNELRSYTQCHFYAGIGIWSYALRLAGWDDNRPVWTFSEPCQPFSAAGKGLGDADKRYLRPCTHHLVKHCRPETVFGEQVASKDGLTWLDTLQSDMEGEDYTFASFDLCAAGFGAPHIRQRLYFVADSESSGYIERINRNEISKKPEIDSGRKNQGMRLSDIADGSDSGGMAESECAGLERHSGNGNGSHEPGRKFPRQNRSASEEGATCGMAITDDNQHKRAFERGAREAEVATPINRQDIIITGKPIGTSGNISLSGPGSLPTNGHWRDADWLFCRDGKWRPVEPGTSPLAHGASQRMGRLRGYGNGIVATQAAEFIQAYRECVE